MGILADDLLGVGDLDIVEHLQSLLVGFLLGHALVDDEGLTQLLVHAEHGVQGGHGLLEDDGDGVAADGIHLLAAELGQVTALEQHLAGGDVAVGVQKLQDGHGRLGLAGAGLTDDADGLAGLQGIGNIVYCLDDALLGFEKGTKILNFKQRHDNPPYFSTLDLGSMTSRRASPTILIQMVVTARKAAVKTHCHQ